MISLTLKEIAQALSGQLHLGESAATEETIVNGDAQTDSREICQGQIFFARRGEVTDGHNFATAAVDAGAALIVAERLTDPRVPHILVEETTFALGALARFVVARVRANGNLTVIGITGSNGKTTTKNLVARILEKTANTVASEKSFNNEVGAPLTMLRIAEETRYLVAEMGASAEAEITRLTDMARPDIGVVLSVGLAHAGGFGSIEATVRAKSEMVFALDESGWAVLNYDDARVRAMSRLTPARTCFFGKNENCQVRATDITSSVHGADFTLSIAAETYRVHFPVLGEHHVSNALAAASVAHLLGVDAQTIVQTLEETTKPAKWRMEQIHCKNGILIINDAYNASPDSMKAALKTLAQIGRERGRTIAVLGEMSELGEFAGPAHDEIGTLAVRLRISETVVIGKDIRRMYISAVNEGAWEDSAAKFFETADEAYKYLLSAIRPQDTVLVKSSNSAGLRFLGDRLGEALR